MAEIENILSLARNKKATDVHIVSGSPVLLRIEGELHRASQGVLNAQTTKDLSYSLLRPEQIRDFEENLDLDFMTSDSDHNRYRVNVSFNDGDVGAVIRLLPSEPMSLEELQLPEMVARMAGVRKGLVLITGSTSQGKTTTMAGMIDAINRHSRKHVVTIEDPIEYVHANKNSIIRQREIGRDTKSFGRGLRAALRQDPDVIAIGEMRDYDTIKTALTAAETGVLVFSTLHIISIDKIIERLLSYAPDGNDGHMRALMSEALLGVIHQELLPTVNGGKRIASEILVVTDAVRNVMRNRGTFHLRNLIVTGQRFGMQTMKSSLEQLKQEGAIAESVYGAVVQNYR
ncbi:MAG: PilT/PilU family type 4a pilus ATPase [Planctomycetota bacterium]|nr:PilT/PilU family type 4a pilus ATPase [Planctomycetota bacterium]